MGDEAVISRVADQCFWFGRYLERVESTARLLQVTAALAVDSELTPQQCWRPVVITAGEQDRFAQLCGPDAVADGDAVQRYLTLDERVPVSLRRSVAAARENARASRDVISLEAWEIVNELYLYLQSPTAAEDFEEHPYGFYRRVRREAQLCLGLLRATMLHDTPLYFCWLGVLLERVGQTARILDVQHHAFLAVESAGRGAHPVVEVSLWLSLLRACYGFEPFMKLHRGTVSPRSVAAFLIFEPRFPRGVRHGLRRVRDLILAVRPVAPGAPVPRAYSRIQALEEWIDGQHGGPLDGETVHRILTRVVDETQAVCDLVQSELIAADPQSQSQSQSQGEGQTQSQSQGLTQMQSQSISNKGA
jgi:uncharacterized alpha-E superfamily protein